MLKLFFADLKMLTRNRQFLFWSLMFPLMFTIIFGLFFGKNASGSSVAITNNSDTEIAKNLESTMRSSSMFQITDNLTFDQAKDRVRKGQLSAALQIPASFGSLTPEAPKQIDFVYDPGNSQASAQIAGFLDSYLTAINFNIQHAQPIFSVNRIATLDKQVTYFDFVLAGILGLALMNSSIIGIAVSITKYREDKILKRITTTPLKSWQFIMAESLSRLCLNVFQIGIVLALGIYAFNGHVYGNIYGVFALALLGGLLFQLIGFVMASFAKSADAAQGMATAITIPMMFLAGVFFPIDQLPKWLFNIVQYLPLAPLLRMIRAVMLDGKSPFENPLNIIIVLSWIVVSFILALIFFRLTEE